MERGGGRVEQGQRIRGALSAQAWNRAQQAADIVLGAGAGVTAGTTVVSRYPAVVFPVKIQPALTVDLKQAGYAIELSSFGAGQYSNFSGVIEFFYGSLAQPRDLITGETDSTILPTVFAVTVEPAKAGTDVVLCAVSGICMAKVNVISASHKYVALPTRRSSSANPEPGVLETSDTGYAVIATRGNPILIKL